MAKLSVLNKLIDRVGLSGFILKVIALIAMTLDHIGFTFFDNSHIFRLLGRLAFPLFAYFIAVGCVYTRNKYRRLLMVFILALICDACYYVVFREIFGNVLITFTFSILMIIIIGKIDECILNKDKRFYLFVLILLILLGTGFTYDYFVNVQYRFFGMLIPVFTYLPYCRFMNVITKDCDNNKLMLSKIGFIIGLLILLIVVPFLFSWYSLLAIPFILLYNGKKGRYSLKYLFYFYYPIHFLIIAGIGYLLGVY